MCETLASFSISVLKGMGVYTPTIQSLRAEQKFMVETVGTPFVKERYFIPASKSILASADPKDIVLTFVTLFVVVATKAGLTVFWSCIVAAALAT